MLNTLWDKNDTNYKHITYPKYDTIKFMFNNYIDTIKNYYSSNGNYIRRPNPLIKLLDLLEIDINNDVSTVFYELDAIAVYISNDIGLVTPVNNKSKPLTSTIIHDMDEYLLYIDEPFNIHNVTETTTPIKCIYTTTDSIFLTHPTKYKLAIPDIDYTIYSVNVVMLGINYYYWMKKQQFLGYDMDPARYLYEEVFTNTIDSLVDVNLFNRFIRIANNETPSKFINSNPFVVKDFSKKLDNMYTYMLKHLSTDRIDYPGYLSNIQLIVEDNLLDILDIADTVLNKRNKWLIWLSRIDYITFIIKHIDKKTNLDRINDVLITLNYNIRSRIFDVDNTDLKYILKNKVDTLLKTIEEL